ECTKARERISRAFFFESRPAMTPHRLWFALVRRLSGQTTRLTAITSGVAPASPRSRTTGREVNAAFVRAVLELSDAGRSSRIKERHERIVRRKYSACGQCIAQSRQGMAASILSREPVEEVGGWIVDETSPERPGRVK